MKAFSAQILRLTGGTLHFVKQLWLANTSACVLTYGCNQFMQLGTAKVWPGTRVLVITFSRTALITTSHTTTSAHASTDVISIQQ